MNYRRLIVGLSALCIVVGSLLATFAPGGFCWHPSVQEIGYYLPSGMSGGFMPNLTSPGPVTGFGLIILGVIGFIVVWSMNPRTAKPALLNL
jgi:hypothetical protein